MSLHEIFNTTKEAIEKLRRQDYTISVESINNGDLFLKLSIILDEIDKCEYNCIKLCAYDKNDEEIDQILFFRSRERTWADYRLTVVNKYGDSDYDFKFAYKGKQNAFRAIRTWVDDLVFDGKLEIIALDYEDMLEYINLQRNDEFLKNSQILRLKDADYFGIKSVSVVPYGLNRRLTKTSLYTRYEYKKENIFDAEFYCKFCKGKEHLTFDEIKKTYYIDEIVLLDNDDDGNVYEKKIKAVGEVTPFLFVERIFYQI